MSSHGLILDTGPFVILVAASVEPSLLGKTKHLKEYSPDDAVLLDGFMRPFHTICLTPHVATEAAHFVSKIAKDAGTKHGRAIRARFVKILQDVDERYVASRVATARPEFAWLDLADCTLLDVAPSDTLLSIDAPLVNYRTALGYPAVNFNHLREAAGLL